VALVADELAVNPYIFFGYHLCFLFSLRIRVKLREVSDCRKRNYLTEYILKGPQYCTSGSLPSPPPVPASPPDVLLSFLPSCHRFDKLVVDYITGKKASLDSGKSDHVMGAACTHTRHKAVLKHSPQGDGDTHMLP
jgi:hypothetical protein